MRLHYMPGTPGQQIEVEFRRIDHLQNYKDYKYLMMQLKRNILLYMIHPRAAIYMHCRSHSCALFHEKTEDALSQVSFGQVAKQQ